MGPRIQYAKTKDGVNIAYVSMGEGPLLVVCLFVWEQFSLSPRLPSFHAWLDILRHHIPDDSVDFVYADPPFNSSRLYNVLFRESTGVASEGE